MLDAQPALGLDAVTNGPIQLKEITDLTITSLATREPPGNWPAPGHWHEAEGGKLARLASDQAFWLAPVPCPLDGYQTSQSDSWATLSLTSPNLSTLLERLVPIHPGQIAEGRLARTVLEHIAVILLRVSASELLILTPRSSAPDAWHAIATQVELAEN